MDKFVRAEIEQNEVKRYNLIQESIVQWGNRYTREEIEKIIDDEFKAEVWINSLYQVNKRNIPAGLFPELVWLSIKRRDKSPIHDWRHLQEIKNELVGPENEAFELYPAESRKVDTANQYHLWVFASPDVRLPVGFTERLVDYNDGIYSKQRRR